jgi:hypothetical protein
MNDFFIDDLFEEPKKKKIKSGLKGKAQERELVKILNERFAKIIAENPSGGAFSRSVGSGNRFGQQVTLSEAASQIYAGDLTCPECFNFVIESKKGYNDIDLYNAFTGKCGGLDEFLKQVETDAKRVGRRELLIWKKDRKNALAFLKTKVGESMPNVNAKMFYLEWTVMALDDLLTMPDNWWFDIKNIVNTC